MEQGGFEVAAVPSPVVGSGLPVLVVALAGLAIMARRRRARNASWTWGMSALLAAQRGSDGYQSFTTIPRWGDNRLALLPQSQR